MKTAQLRTHNKASQGLSFMPMPAGFLIQRKCACGGSVGLSGSCVPCQQRKLRSEPLRAKLRVNQPGYPYEREADRVADEFMLSVASSGMDQSSLGIQRLGSGEMGAAAASDSVQDVLASAGQPLDGAVRAFFEPRFGHDFAHVRIHADRRAAVSASDIHALAYTVGRDVVFGEGQYQPNTTQGKRLLAHELTHVVQQTSAGGRIQRKPGPKDACPPREPGETKASAGEPYDLKELSPRQEWLIYGFGVGSSAIEPAKGDIAGLMSTVEWVLAKGHFVYVLGQDPLEVLGYSDCHVGKATPNERLRIERAANFCAAYKQKLFDRLGSHKTFNRLIASCRPAPAEDYVASNATKEGRARNRGVLIRVLPPSMPQGTALPYDEKYGPTEGHCGTYLGVENFLNREYSRNAHCACMHTPDEPHNNCVRKCLQVKMWRFLAENADALRSGNFVWCPSVWKHHRECYAECMCDRGFIDFTAFAPLCSIKTGCAITGLTIELFNPCMESKK